jgi:hypothetical protein
MNPLSVKRFVAMSLRKVFLGEKAVFILLIENLVSAVTVSLKHQSPCNAASVESDIYGLKRLQATFTGGHKQLSLQ